MNRNYRVINLGLRDILPRTKVIGILVVQDVK